MGSHKRDNDFTVRFCLEYRIHVEIRPQKKMIVNFTVDCKDSLSIWTDEWLCAGVLRVVEEGVAKKKKKLDSPTPTIASRSWTRIVFLPT